MEQLKLIEQSLMIVSLGNSTTKSPNSCMKYGIINSTDMTLSQDINTFKELLETKHAPEMPTLTFLFQGSLLRAQDSYEPA